MLRRRSIRTKLIVALAFLSAIVLLLAVSGFWGFHGYQRSTNALIIRATELSHAHMLDSHARVLHDSNDRILDLLSNEGLIDPLNPNSQNIETEVDQFAATFFSFEMALSLYPVESTTEIDDESSGEQLGLNSVRESVAIVATYCNGPIVFTTRELLDDELEQLVTKTADHVLAIDEDMGKLSRASHAHYRTWTTMAWICGGLALLMVGILLWSFNSLVVKPFRTLLDGSRLVAGGQFDHRIDLGTGDELSELAIAMNEMTDRFQGALNKVNSWCTDLDQQVRDRTREVIQNEQLASVGFLAAGVAHEINNPLATIAWSAESLESRVGEIAQLPLGERTVDAELSECLTQNLRRIEEEAFRCKSITEKLLDFSRLSEVRRAPTNLVDLVNDVASMVGKVGKYRCNRLQVHSTSDVIAHINPQEIRQVVLNLVTNGLESVDIDGAVDIHVACDGVTASIAIEDNGCGMSDEVLKHLFEPFFTRRRDGTGTGLGLSITYRIVSQHGGSLTAQSGGEGCGSRMEILLPVEPEDNDTAQSRNALGLTS